MLGIDARPMRTSCICRLLLLWYSKTSSDKKTVTTVKAKVNGFLKKLNSYQFVCLVFTYVGVLELITPISKVFKGEGLLISQVKPTLTETITDFNEEI